MPWLGEVSQSDADELAALLGYPTAERSHFGAVRAQEPGVEGAGDPDLRELRLILQELIADAQRNLPFFGGTDLRAPNIGRTAQGQLQLIDPVFVAGRRIIAALRSDFAAVTQSMSPAELRAFLQLPCFEDAGHDPAFRELVAIVAGLEP